MCCKLLNHLSTDGYFGSFKFDILHNAPRNNLIHRSFQVQVTVIKIDSKSEIVRWLGNTLFYFDIYCQIIIEEGCIAIYFCTFTKHCQQSVLAFLLWQLKNALHIYFNLHIEIEHVFKELFAICISSWVNCLCVLKIFLLGYSSFS